MSLSGIDWTDEAPLSAAGREGSVMAARASDRNVRVFMRPEQWQSQSGLRLAIGIDWRGGDRGSIQIDFWPPLAFFGGRLAVRRAQRLRQIKVK